MSYIQNFFTSRDNNIEGNTYVGQQDRLWWNPDTNAIYVNTANTVGGTPVTLPSTVNLSVNTLTANSGNIIGNLVVGGNISPAAEGKIGGIIPGPGANVSNTGLLTIDTTGLPLSFGNFTANNNVLTIVNVDENMILETQGDAEIQLIGNIGFYKTNGGGVPDPADRYFFAKEDGQIFFYISDEDPLEAAIDIVGTTSGNVIPPGITGAMLQVTGQANIPCRIYYDGVNNYVSWVARRYNGNVAAPTQVLSGEDVLRINATAATDAGVGNVAMAQISISSLENQTTTAQGSQITFTVTPVGSAASSRVNVANVTVANGVTATKFTTAGTVAATGNITGGNILTAGLISVTGNVTGGNILDSKGDVRSIPVNTKNTGYTLEATDAGKIINMTTGNVTVPAGVFATPFGQAITIYNDQNASNAIVQGSGVTMRLAGTTATGNRTLARYGLATVVCVSANTFVISGAGLT
jgi:hypothetical protein